MMEYQAWTGAEPYTMVLKAGDDLFGSIRSFMIEGGFRDAQIVYCIGSIDKAEVCYPRDKTLPPTIDRVSMEGVYEICVMSGNARRDGDKVHVHLHGSFAEKGKEVFGGAIVDGTRVFKVAEILMLARR